MNKKITTAYYSILLFILFAGCKKDDTIQTNSSNVQLLVLEPYVTDTTTAIRTYKLRGTIVSPGRIDMKDYGFFVKDSTPVQVKLGSAKKAGYIEHDYSSATQLTSADIVMYAILAGGDTLYSTSSSSGFATTTSSGIAPSFQMTGFVLTPLPSTDLYLTSGFTYNTASGYAVTNYDLLYKLSTDPNFSTFSLIPFSNNNQVSNLSLQQNLGIVKGNSYDFEIHVILSPPAGSTSSPFDYTTPVSSSSY